MDQIEPKYKLHDGFRRTKKIYKNTPLDFTKNHLVIILYSYIDNEGIS